MSEKKVRNIQQKSELSQKVPRSSSSKHMSRKSSDHEQTDPSTVLSIPEEDLMSRYKVSPLSSSFPKLKNVKLPFVRDVGVKIAVDQLSDILGCKEYKLNTPQFWFLDIIAECLWRAQDDFQFPDHHQKVILEWVLYTFNLIRDERLDLSRKILFKIIREALTVAEDYTGRQTLPLPEELFSLNLTERIAESPASSDDSGSEISVNELSETGSYLAIEFPEETKIFKLPKKIRPWTSDDECLSSSVETLSEDERPSLDQIESEDVTLKEETSDSLLDEEMDFWKPDMRTPPRFRPSVESIYESSVSTMESVVESSEGSSGDATWIASSRAIPKVPCPSKILDVEDQTPELTEKQKEEQVLQALFDYHLWQIRKEDMADPRKGAVFSVDSFKDRSLDHGDAKNENERNRELFANYLKGREEETEEFRKNMFVNACVILAIKQFIFDYFYESFHFFLLKTVFRSRHNLITQELNDKWYVPKVIKGELKKPLPRKIKKPKKEKVKKPKKEKKAGKKSKGSKSTKKSKKSKSTGKSKKSKSTKKSDKSEKGKKKVKLAKATHMSKEEKEELARIEREQRRLEEERRKAEENRRFMFPLTDAATDQFFQGIFEEWVRPKAKEKKEKKKKEGKGKKSDKSDGSKKSKGKGKDKGSEKTSKKGKGKKK